MTIAEFKEYNRTNTMPCEWIGQGYGYKSEKEWDYIDLDEIIYIPEHGYNDITQSTADRENVYSKRDFIQLIRELDDRYLDIGRQVEVKRMAAELFEAVDWQFPESLLNEGFFED